MHNYRVNLMQFFYTPLRKLSLSLGKCEGYTLVSTDHWK
jgi:hypothetical protein